MHCLKHAFPLTLCHVYLQSRACAGGAKADKEVKAAIKKALKPAALPDAPRVSQMELFRCDMAGHRLDTERFYVPKSHPEWYCRNGRTQVSAVWDSEALAREYDMTVMAGPLLPGKADQDLLAGEKCCQSGLKPPSHPELFTLPTQSYP